ncbi:MULTISPECIES: Bug family tripartite tricarboxylate transporter substrate binding protein [Bacillaceae]|uniref:Tripartite tricarboxylate transporter family receptor n=1 Tax=Alkalicoccobacillus plakortidis TaxID=444060 RepID=A0A9D5DWH6_9BACI|nr:MULTISPECIES: tripartite tricarboxylate transporter substrate-binding protein [Bacillaceae]KQL58453.1 hypothetical protein AN965_03990 [Alkalicoccobacillus plakortidis]
MKTKYLPFFIVSSCLLFTACNTIEANDASDQTTTGALYKDSVISFVVPFQAGGGTDVFARFMTPYFSEHISGSPRVQVENIPGGGSITGTNEYAQTRKPNGRNILTTSGSSHIPYILGQGSVQYDLSNMTPIIGSPSGGVVYTNPEKAAQGVHELVKTSGELFYAGMSPTGLDLITLLSFEVLNLDVKAVLGYEGKGPSRVAFEQGESNIDYQTTTAYNRNVVPLVEEGRAVPLYSLGQIDENGELIRDPQFPDLPTIEELYIDLHDEVPSGEAWEAYKQFVGAGFTLQKAVWVHDDAPEAHKQELHSSMVSLIEDEQFQAQSEEILENYQPFIGDDLQDRINAMLDVNESTINWVREFLLENYDVDVNRL